MSVRSNYSIESISLISETDRMADFVNPGTVYYISRKLLSRLQLYSMLYDTHSLGNRFDEIGFHH